MVGRLFICVTPIYYFGGLSFELHQYYFTLD